MAEQCGIRSSKLYLLIFNLVFLVAGILVLVVGGYITNDVVNYGYFMEQRVIVPPILLVIAGIVVFIAAFCGCFGAVRENFSMLMVFCIGLSMIFILELSVGVIAWSYSSNFYDIMKERFTESINAYNSNDKKAWDIIQQKLQCCGKFDFRDWYVIKEFRATETLPASCCTDLKSNEVCNNRIISKINDIGCYNALETRIQIESTVLIWIGIGVAIVELIGISLSCRFATSVRRSARALLNI